MAITGNLGGPRVGSLNLGTKVSGQHIRDQTFEEGQPMSANETHAELLTRSEAARLCGIGERTLSRWAAEGRAPRGLKLSAGQRGAVRWRRNELLAWINAGCPGPDASPTRIDKEH